MHEMVHPFLCVAIRLISWMVLYFLMEVLGDNIQRDGAKRNRAEGGVSGSVGGKLRGMTVLRFGQANVELCRFPTFALI